MPRLAELRPGWFGLALDDLADFPTNLALPAPRCCAFVACDTRGRESTELVEIGRRLLTLGAVYVCAWGPGCGRFETCVDKAIVESGVEHGDEDCIVTTSHANETLDEALRFFEICAQPAESYASAAGLKLVIAAGVPGVLETARVPRHNNE